MYSQGFAANVCLYHKIIGERTASAYLSRHKTYNFIPHIPIASKGTACAEAFSKGLLSLHRMSELLTVHKIKPSDLCFKCRIIYLARIAH